MILYFDTETYQGNPALDLPKVGVYRYTEGVEVCLFGYAIDNDPAEVWDIAAGQAMPESLADALENADVFVAHNAPFDVPVIASALGITVPLEKVHCTQAQALAHGMPGSLEQVGQALGLGDDQAKMKEGKRLVARFCKPAPANHKADRYGPDNDPENWAKYVEYCRRDVEAMRELYNRLPRFNYPDNPSEYTLWLLDQKINARGLPVDRGGVDMALSLIQREKQQLDARAAQLSGGDVRSAGNIIDMGNWLEARGLPLPDLQKATVSNALRRKELPETVRQMLVLRQQASKTSTAKYDALARATGTDGRIRGTLQYCGASRTGRWSGRLFQPQNLMRPTIDGGQAAQAIINGSAAIVYDDVMEAAGSAVRGMICAPEGRQLVVADLSNIEGRVLAWLADEDWKLEAFRDYDNGVGPDLYKLAYSKSFNVPVDQVSGDQRQVGKVMELALGYQGGVGAFQTMAAIYGVEVDDEKADELKIAWRQANRQIQQFWYQCQEAAISAIQNHRATYLAGDLKFKTLVVGRIKYLFIGLPSGRLLCYASPKYEDGELSYLGVNQYTRKWERITTYGGKLVENVTQAVARDVMANAMPAIEGARFEIVSTVHDEIITLAPISEGFTADRLAARMAAAPDWADSLPLAAAGYEAQRYRK